MEQRKTWIILLMKAKSRRDLVLCASEGDKHQGWRTCGQARKQHERNGAKVVNHVSCL